MNNILEYKNYHAKIEFDKEDMLFVGEVFGIQDSINFHGRTIEELVENFHQSIDNYLEVCKEYGRNPDKEFRGSFNVRIDPALHRRAALAALRSGVTLNQYVEQAIQHAVIESEYENTYVITSDLTHVPRRKEHEREKIADYQNTPMSYNQRGVLS